MQEEENVTTIEESSAVGDQEGTGEALPVKKHNGFTGKIGFVLAAAGSAVGLGNLWRFPYLAAKYGGGIFLLVYIALAVTFGFSLLVLEIAIGRHTGKDVIGAFAKLNKKTKWFGFVSLVVPVLIVPYYCVIGGWVTKYLFAYLSGDGTSGAMTGENAALYFNNFISSPWQPIVFFIVFALLSFAVVIFGVQKGIEKIGKILMPLLAVLSVGLAIFAMCQKGALEGVKYFLVPKVEGVNIAEVFLAALGQLFYSMSLAMCIMITYGSYMKKDTNIQKSARQISVFDTGFAIVAGLIIIPSVFAFSTSPSDVMQNSGPTLMFVSLPNVFSQIPGANIIGALFFLLVLFAALTSAISLIEAIVAVLRENLGMKRWQACLIVFGVVLLLGIPCSLGFGVLKMLSIGDMTLLDIFDYVSNSILMPLVAIGTCVIAGYFVNFRAIKDEIGLRVNSFRDKYFTVMIRFVAPICMLLILIFNIIGL